MTDLWAVGWDRLRPKCLYWVRATRLTTAGTVASDVFASILQKALCGDCSDCVLQALRAKCLQLEDDVRVSNDKLKQAQDVVAEKDRYIDVCDVDF